MRIALPSAALAAIISLGAQAQPAPATTQQASSVPVKVVAHTAAGARII